MNTALGGRFLTFGTWALLFTHVTFASAQSVNLSLGSASGTPGTSANVDVAIAVPVGATAATVQWVVNYSATDVSSIQVTAGAAATAAGKTVLCTQSTSSVSCIAYGLDSRTLASGVLARLSVAIRANSAATTIPLSLSGVMVASSTAASVPAAGAGSTLAVNQVVPALSGISCPGTTLIAPSSMNCTVSLTSAAGAAGFPVSLASSGVGVTVPSSVTIAAGATSGVFAVMAANGSAGQTVTLTASAAGVSRTATLTTTPASWTISGSVSPSATGSGTLVNLSTAASTNTISSAGALENPSANLIAAYGFDEGSGATANDGSGNGNHGAIAQAAWSSAGRFGRALSFNGTSSLVTIPDAPELDLTGAMTVEAWVNPATSSGWRTVLLKESANGLAYGLYANDDRNLPGGYLNVGGPDRNATGPVTIPANTWSHLALTFDGTIIQLYVNGVLAASEPVAGSIIATAGPLRIGGNTIWGEYFQGLIDEVRVYSRVLTAAEIQGDMESPVTVAAAMAVTSQVDASGNFQFANLSDGTYVVTPVRAGTRFIPATREITVAGSSVSNVNFTIEAAATYTISGTLGAAGAGATVALSGAATQTATASSTGAYSFTGLANGTYTVTPTKSGTTFTPASQNVTVNGANATANFTSAVVPAPTWSISGTLGAAGAGATVALSGAASRTATASSTGAYSFTGLANGAYTVTPTKAGTTFTPASQNVTVNGANATANFASAVPTWSISGTLGAAGAGATVALSGAATQTATASSTGAYSFTGLANGAYTVTPTKSGTTFTPASQNVTVNGANATANFTSAVPTWSISGTLGTAGAGATVALSGAASRTATAGSTGSYSFTGLANGAYTVTPTKAGTTFTPASQNVTVNGANATANFTSTGSTPGAILPDVNVSAMQLTDRNWIASPAFSTNSGSQTILALISSCRHGGTSSNVRVRSVAGGGLTWVRVIRTNVQDGTAEIWRAVAPARLSNVSIRAEFTQLVSSAITVQSYTGVDTTTATGGMGAMAGSSSASGIARVVLTTTRPNSQIVAVGSDIRLASARTLIAGQTLTSQHLVGPDHTFWTQRLDKGVGAAGTAVTVGVTAPSNAQFNFSAVELLAAPVTASNASFPGVVSPVSEPLEGKITAEPSTSSAQRPVETATLAHAATGLPGDACSPGGLATLYGRSFSAEPVGRAAQFPLPRRLSGVEVHVNGHSVPLLMVSDTQINFQCPAGAPGMPLDIVVSGADGREHQVRSVMQESAPGLFLDPTGKQVLVQAPDRGDGRAEAPRREDFITLFASGLGATVDPVEPGASAPTDRLSPVRNGVRVWVGGVPVVPSFAGLAPGMAGLYQINLEIPATAAPGTEIPILLEVTLPDGRVVYSNTAKLPLAGASGE